MRILLAEDDRVSRTIMKRMLQSFGYEVVEAIDGRKAVEILRQSDGPRLALVDWMMPELDGVDLCREIRSQHSDDAYVYILLLTSKQGSDDLVAGLEAGADDYITKPCQPAELKARLSTGLRILSLEQKLVEAREEMRYKATHDALTGLWNRAALLPIAEAELARGVRESATTCLVLCDIDHFKHINDNHGHSAGDAVLQEVARRLKSSLRGYDAVGRYGGEEFLILLSGCEPGALNARCEELRHAVGSRPIEAATKALSVSISLGAVWHAAEDGGVPVEKLLARADAALYRAKHEGRNRAAFATPELLSLSNVSAASMMAVGTPM